jgi:Zn-dependent M28 family amino/carboxypeptidase
MVKGLINMHAKKFKDFKVNIILGKGKFIKKRSIEVIVKGGEEKKLRTSQHKVMRLKGMQARDPLFVH